MEREPVPGGRAGIVERAGYRMDNGPCVMTMPGLLRDAFEAMGADMDDHVTIDPVDPMYRAVFDDGSALRVLHGVEAMTEEIRRVCGPRDAARFAPFCDWLGDLYRLEMADFIDCNFDSPLDYLRRVAPLLQIVRTGGLRTVHRKVASFFEDDRLHRIFSFQAMYAGLSPFDALAIYCVITYMDSVEGVSFPRGGMHSMATGLAAAITAHGGEVRLGTAVERIERGPSGAVSGVRLADGTTIAADAVVANPDLPVAYRQLLGREPWNVRRLTYSPSCFLLLAGSSATYSKTAHHNIHFGNSWDGVFEELIEKKQLMSDPSLLVTVPTHDDKSLAPKNRESYYVLFPTPNLSANIDWRIQAPKYRDEMVGTLEKRGYVGFGDAIGDLGQHLGGGNAHRHRQPQPPPHVAAQGVAPGREVATAGVTGMRFKYDGDYVKTIAVCNAAEQLLVAREDGIGKRTPFEDYRLISRGGTGVIAIDLPGFGLAEKSWGRDYSHEAQARFALSVLDQLHVERAVLLGHGNDDARKWFEQQIRARHPKMKIIQPQPGKTVEV
mgnify:CR=1 FL=1